ncbi:response regulator [Persicimonas caeni]|uniref:histidine kinase n=1 Tax=Persicimonas caeni TaxID=2292766 RepID=A0A4Y6PMJ1_PERCE|nr:response regulator [Persicimonas caeni]QDG49526.1 response regulator [Persicimonas caeni]QED30747.1 response regulator [Persicimonas caeni]
MVEIIVVEDELAHAELIRRAFETRADEFEVEVVSSLARARERLAETTPDLVITDLMLPDGSGIDLIPGEDQRAEYPVVVMTSHGDEKVAVEAIKAGALDYLVKSAETLSTMPHIAERSLREWNQMHELERTQQQLLHAQKMEAIGNLSSGIAHDFNNLLMGITGCTDLALGKLDEGNDARRYVEEIKKAALRGASLTRQLLAFTRKKEVEPRVVEFNEVVAEAKNLLRPVLSEDISFDVDLSDARLYVRCDPGQIEQVLVNLVVNARDAMPQGGQVRVSTTSVEVDEAGARRLGEVPAGEYVVLSVADNGTGIDPETLEHIFEPFYTTKDVGQGTGLGLSTIYGIVKQVRGEIVVDSEVGRGTTFHIYLPRTDEEPEQLTQAPTHDVEGNGETILVVEDESLVRLTVRGYLERGGYRVVTAKDGDEALAIAGGAAQSIDVLLTDMVLPGLKGPDIVEKVRGHHPDIQVLYMSAHSAEQLLADARLDADADVLQKPFTEIDLLTEVYQLLRAEPSVAIEDAAADAPTQLDERRERSQAGLLLVEDHDTARWTIRELLQDEGYTVYEAADGAAAVEVFDAHASEIDLVISDMRLPDVAGTSLVGELRQQKLDKQKRDMAVIFTSGKDADDPKVRQAVGAPHTTFLGKPVDFDGLLDTVERMLEALANDQARSAAQ